MNQKAELLYRQMQLDLELCRKKQLGPLCEVECCFQIAEHYWAKLRRELPLYDFPSLPSEIEFFKRIKPKFTSEVEYYSLLYYAELFRRDVKDEVEQKRFWERERQRLVKFTAENVDFYVYYKSGKFCQDAQYFTRGVCEIYNFPRVRVYNVDERTSTTHDALVSSILALERYMDFIDKEVDKLN